MKYHCGLLDERPDHSRTLNWIKTPNWDHLPPDVHHELQVWLAMPGFPVAWQAHNLRHGRRFIENYPGDYNRYRAEVDENWISASREDCVRLAQMRPGMGDVPLISQLKAVEDLKSRSQASIAADYGVRPHTIHMWWKHGVRFRGELPRGFALLTSSKSFAL